MRISARLALAAVTASICMTGAVSQAAPKAKAKVVRPAAAPAPTPSEAVKQVAEWVIASGDNREMPFAIVDKVMANVFVFDVKGEPRGASAVLLGFARGDEPTPGVGDRQLSSIKPEERTTPAGRFLTAYGPANGAARVLWVDYATAISMHPVPSGNPKEQRIKRLRSASAEDNRITYGCINVSAAFYEKVVRRTFKGPGGVVYVLPEEKSLAEALPAFRPVQRASNEAVEDGLDSTPSAEGGLSDNAQLSLAR